MMLGPSNALNILLRFEEDRRKAILLAGSPERREQLIRNQAYPEGSVGRLMEPPIAVFGPNLTVTQAVEQLRELEVRSEEHTSELQSPYDLVCRLLLEKKKIDSK